jgi:CheY-like chemotaxis protein
MEIDQTVLLIEDDNEVRTRISGALRNAGFKTIDAASAAEGLAAADAQQPSLIIVDMDFGTRSESAGSGLEVLRTIRANKPDIRLVAFSSHVGDWEGRAELLGGTAWIEKASALSASAPDLNAVIKRLLETPGAESHEPPGQNEVPATEEALEIPSSPILELNTIDLLLYQQLQRQPELLKSLDWRTFERLLADILETFGYRVELMQGTKDGGIDIIAFSTAEMGSHKYLVQAKRWSHKVGVEPVQRLLFLQSHEKATKSCLATTGQFTRGAWRLADQYEWQLSLRDYQGLQEWIDRAVLRKGSAGRGPVAPKR